MRDVLEVRSNYDREDHTKWGFLLISFIVREFIVTDVRVARRWPIHLAQDEESEEWLSYGNHILTVLYFRNKIIIPSDRSSTREQRPLNQFRDE